MKGKMKKITAVAALAAAIILTGGGPLSGFMPDGASAAAVTFTDVAGNYWAYSDIDFAAQKGIVNGYDAAGGTHVFYPENQVSYEEAATMLYRALGAAGRLRTDSSGSAGSGGTANALTEDQQSALIEKHAETLSAANISEWAKAYVSYGLEYDIIEESELANFVNAGTKLGNPAPRISVAVWTAKALDKQAAGAYYLPFTDASQIDDASAKYVDILYRHGIMKGSWQPDGTVAFQPSSGVKRSEFAAISNRVFNNAGTDYDISKEMYNHKIESGQQVKSDKLRIASGSTVIGSETDCSAVSGISFKEGEKAQVFLVGAPEASTGTIKSVENINKDTIKIGIQTDGKGTGRDTIYYIFDKDTESTAKITNGTNVTFIADGVRLVEIK